MGRRIYLLLFFGLGGLLTTAQEQRIPSVSVLYDVSLSMSNRDTEKELDFLEGYFYERPECNVNFVPFSNEIWPGAQFQIRGGNWQSLKERIENMAVDGASSLSGLANFALEEEILLFTDGRHSLGNETPVFSGNLHIVNSSPSPNVAQLNLLAILNSAQLHNIVSRKNDEAGIRHYSGTVYSDFADISQLDVRVAGSTAVTAQLESNGRFALQASPGDTLLVLFQGRRLGSKRLGESPEMNIWVEEQGAVRLEEVVLTQKRENRQADLVKTASGSKNRDAVGVAVQSIDGSQVSEAATNGNASIQGKFSGVSLGTNDDLSQFETRTKWSMLSNNYGLIVIDGVPMGKSNSSAFASATSNQNTSYIDPRNIADITVLKGLVATNRFGSAGANGVLLITTRAGSFSKAKEKKDQALKTDNIYDGRIKVGKQSYTTDYLAGMRKARTVEEAYEIYLAQRQDHINNPSYFLDLHEYFKEASPKLALRILSNILEKEQPSLQELRGLLFSTAKLGNAQLQLQTAQYILELYPQRADAHLNHALAQRAAGNYQLALDLLLEMAEARGQGQTDFSGIRKTLERELANLANQHAGELKLDKLPTKYHHNIRYNARLVVEWSPAEAEFEIQFVNPQKRFFSWEHRASGERMRQELETGFSLEEFEIFGQGVSGEWLLNASLPEQSANTKSNTPVWLRCRVIQDFGSPGQSESEYIMRLHEKGSAEQLAKLKVE